MRSCPAHLSHTIGCGDCHMAEHNALRAALALELARVELLQRALVKRVGSWTCSVCYLPVDKYGHDRRCPFHPEWKP